MAIHGESPLVKESFKLACVLVQAGGKKIVKKNKLFQITPK